MQIGRWIVMSRLKGGVPGGALAVAAGCCLRAGCVAGPKERMLAIRPLFGRAAAMECFSTSAIWPKRNFVASHKKVRVRP